MLNISTLSAKKALKPNERNYLMINLDFRYEDRINSDKNNAIVFILDDSSDMTEFIDHSTKYQYAIEFIYYFTKNMTENDMISVIKLSDDKIPLIPMSKNKNISTLYKTYPQGIPDIVFSLTNAKTILDEVNDKKYNKSIIIISNSEISQYTSESLTEIAKPFYSAGIRITTISLNEFAELGILPMVTNGNYYSLESKRHFDRIIHKELWRPNILLGRNIEIILPKNPNIEWEYNLQGFTQKINKNKSISIFIGKSFGHSEIIIPYTVRGQQKVIKWNIKAKYKDYKSDKVNKTKTEETIEVRKKECTLHKIENETVIYRAMYEFKNLTYLRIDRLLEKELYFDAIDILTGYIYELKKFINFASSTKPIEILTKEASLKIKEIKRKMRTQLKA